MLSKQQLRISAAFSCMIRGKHLDSILLTHKTSLYQSQKYGDSKQRKRFEIQRLPGQPLIEGTPPPPGGRGFARGTLRCTKRDFLQRRVQREDIHCIGKSPA